ncbi:hypothetical protein RRG08_058953 [Elysia crispata]|uniref:Uncharacterized protein n=1 Tax=Elysia crispata TaxID=231223 RepID=A0AAE0XRP4_9GAST|nr:hypothetical protein RRG08_058953 [Elysia crispata]
MIMSYPDGFPLMLTVLCLTVKTLMWQALDGLLLLIALFDGQSIDSLLDSINTLVDQKDVLETTAQQKSAHLHWRSIMHFNLYIFLAGIVQFGHDP